MIKKRMIFGILLIFMLSSISALSLDINSEAVVNTIINDGDKPVVFEFNILNKGASGNFEIFSFERFKIEPNEFSLGNGDSINLKVSFLPEGTMRENIGALKFPVIFKEKGSSDTFSYDLSIKLVNFDEAFDFKAENVNPSADSLTLTFYNVEDIYYDEVNLVFTSEFFEDRSAKVTLDPFEKEIFAIPISKNDFKKLVSGTYYIDAEYLIEGREGNIGAPVKLLESSGIIVTEDNGGIIVNTRTINKHNEGNIPTISDIVVKKNVISRLFTTFSVEPQRVERDGFSVNYFWQKELQPDETLSVKVITNWLFPLLILIGIIAIFYLFNMYTLQNVVVKKRVSFVNTKGGEFALKVTLKVKARKFANKVILYDRLPAMAHLYNKYGDSPENFNKVSGRLQWDIEHLGEGEERMFSYVLYSKMKVIGKFELPSATVMYETEGKLHEARSNRAFFINEPKEVVEED